MRSVSGNTYPIQTWRIRQYPYPYPHSIFCKSFHYPRVPNHYICPIFKWGSMEEFQFGIERVLQFPKSRKQNERTYLLKTLAGCPTQPEKIIRLLEQSTLGDNSNFTENDQFLIYSSLTATSSGHYTLLKFLSSNWTTIREK